MVGIRHPNATFTSPSFIKVSVLPILSILLKRHKTPTLASHSVPERSRVYRTMLALTVLKSEKHNPAWKEKVSNLRLTCITRLAPGCSAVQANFPLVTCGHAFPSVSEALHYLSCSHICSSSRRCSLNLAIPSLSGRPKASVILFSRMLLRPWSDLFRVLSSFLRLMMSAVLISSLAAPSDAVAVAGLWSDEPKEPMRLP